MRLPYRFGRYLLVERIAAGGTAEIYRAVLSAKGGFSKTVAVKRLLPSWGGNGEVEAMLVDEAKALSMLQHRAIVQVMDLGFCEGSPFIAMEYVDGMDCAGLLAKLIRERSPLPAKLALYIAEQTLSALDFAHRSVDETGVPMGIVHRDVSPPNILLSWSGEVKVADFGIAKGSHRSRRTQLGQLKGKFSYMSPEQARGEDTDHRSDIYACGIVLCELVTARRIFEGRGDFEVLEKVRSAKSPPSDISGLSPELRATLMLSLAAEPSMRYQSAEEMRRDVHRCAEELGSPASPGDLSSFLASKFPGAGEARFVSPIAVSTDFGRKTVPMGVYPESGSGRMRRILLRIAGAAAIAALLSTAPASKAGPVSTKGDPLPKRPKIDVPVLQEARPMQRTGAVVVDSVPTRAGGRLVIGGEERIIITPFALEGLDIRGGLSCRVDLNAPGYQTASEDFELSPSRPSFVKRIALKPSRPASISVNARPWGLVDIPGAASNRETPVSRLGLKEGAHSVTVRHPPSGSSVTRRVLVSGGQNRTCNATFGARPSLICR